MSKTDLRNAKFIQAVNSEKLTEDLVRIVIEVPPGYRRAIKTIAAAEDTTIKELLMEGIEHVCKVRNIPIRS